MKKYNRRDFIENYALLLSALSIGGMTVSCNETHKNIFKYAFCNIILEDISWPEQCEIIAKAGYSGVEIAPLTLINESIEELSAKKRQQLLQDLKNAGIVCAGLHRLFGLQLTELHFTTPDNHIRQKTVNEVMRLIDFCADMGGEFIVWGSPNQRGTIKGITVKEALNYFIDGLIKIADHAQQQNIKILLEPISIQYTDIVNTLSDALEIINKIDHPAVSTMFDFQNSADETEPLHQLVKKYFNYIDHVHFQNLDGSLVKSNDIPKDHIQVFKALAELKYKKWISVEVFDYSPGGIYIANECMKTFLEIEKRLL